jgi:ribosome-associated protein
LATPTEDVNRLLATAVAAAEDKKAEDIVVLKLDPTESGLTDYFLICTGTNTRQTSAIADEIELRLKREFGVYCTSVEGHREGEWVLMDFFNFIVHIFTPEKRAFYGLERLRKSATTVDAAELNAELKEETTKVAAKRTAKKSATKKTAAKKSVAKKASAKVAAKKVAAKKTSAKKTSAKKTAAKKSSAR